MMSHTHVAEDIGIGTLFAAERLWFVDAAMEQGARECRGQPGCYDLFDLCFGLHGRYVSTAQSPGEMVEWVLRRRMPRLDPPNPCLTRHGFL